MTETRFEACKYKGKWAVYDSVSCRFDYIGRGKSFCEWIARDLNRKSKLTSEEYQRFLLNE